MKSWRERQADRLDQMCEPVADGKIDRLPSVFWNVWWPLPNLYPDTATAKTRRRKVKAKK